MRLPRLSLTTKLNLLLAVAAGVALLVSCVSFVTNDIRMLRAAKVNHLTALADVLGIGGFEALARGDLHVAREVLRSLRSQPTVAFGGLYDSQGALVSTYHHPDTAVADAAISNPEGPGHSLTPDGKLAVCRHVEKDGQHLGKICLHATLGDVWEEFIHYVRIVALISVASLSASVLMSSRLQRLVSAPIVGLTQTAQQISAESDYSIRVQKTSDDELGTLYDEFNAMLDRVAEGKHELQEAHAHLESRVAERTAQLLQANLELSREIAERERAEQELAVLHQKLVDAAHRAGMAEIATDVLHNVGNVLNSVNVSCQYAIDQLRASSVPQVQRVADLIETHLVDLGEFLTADERGRKVPGFIKLLAEQLRTERSAMLQEMDNLAKNVDHIKSIVAMQQSYAGVSGVVEPVVLSDLLDDALRLNDSWLKQYAIEVIRQYAPLPLLLAQKQKLLQVLVNLVQNARDALIASGRPDPRLILRIVQTADETVSIELIDNGIGIPHDNLTRIFSHGFTTKEKGHGFGLHSCANAAREMGGELSVQSAGAGCGATFSLALPLRTAEVPV